jgi:hypothetical protein
MAVVKRKVCTRESQRSIVLSGKLEKDEVEAVNSAASAAYLNQSFHSDGWNPRLVEMLW